MKYVPFTEEEKTAANTTDLVSFLQMRGERLVRAGREHKLIYTNYNIYDCAGIRLVAILNILTLLY